MKITPLDIQQKAFRRVLRGYDPQEVEAFLSLVATEFEELVKEAMSLREEVRRKVEEVAEYRSREKSLQETLITAQKASEEIREASRKEAEIAISEAELQGEKIVQAAHSRFLRIVDDINELKRQRAQFEVTVRSLVEGHLKLLEAFREPQQREEQVELLRGAKKASAD
jgi:cell division initiation protein